MKDRYAMLIETSCYSIDIYLQDKITGERSFRFLPIEICIGTREEVNERFLSIIDDIKNDF